MTTATACKNTHAGCSLTHLLHFCLTMRYAVRYTSTIAMLHICAAHVWNSNTTAPSASGKKGRQLHLGSFQDGERAAR